MKRTLAIVLCLLMLLCVLPAGTAVADGELPFTDVNENDIYYDAVVWAYQNGITSGTSATTFSPDKIILKKEMVQMAWRAAGSPEPFGSGCYYTDIRESAYYYKAAKWAWENCLNMDDWDNPHLFNSKAKLKGYEVLHWAIAAKYKEGPISIAYASEGTGYTEYCTRGMAVYILYKIVCFNATPDPYHFPGV